MGSTLTNTQPKDTYKSLLKTSDSTELSATAKYVSDGNGNDSALALGTTKVGIGTDGPESRLHIASTATGSDVTLYIDNRATSTLNNSARLKFSADAGATVSGGGVELNCLNVNATNGAVDLFIKSWTGGAYTEKARFLAGGGLTFNGDTAAANALDDYEEGTWTPSVAGTSVAGTATYAVRNGKYTKVGNQVSFILYIDWNSGTGTGAFTITGLPFTVSAGSDFASANIGYVYDYVISASSVLTAFCTAASNTIVFKEYPLGGGANTNAAYDASGGMIISGTYFV